MKTIGWVFLGIVVGITGTTSVAQNPPPGFGAVAQYRFGIGAKALSLGAAFTATAEGAEGLYWNPAGLVGTSASIGGMYTEPFSGLGGQALDYRIQYLGVVAPVNEVGLGAGWFNVHVGGIPYSDEGSTFDYDSSVFLGGLATRLDLTGATSLAVGLTAKLYRERMLEGHAQGVGFDVGLLADFGAVRVGYCSQDVGGTRYRWQGTGQEPEMQVPWVHRVGVSARWSEGLVTTSGEAVLEGGASPSLRLGAEWAPIENLALRGGVRLEAAGDAGYQAVWSAGFGVLWSFIILDAAYLRNPVSGFSGGSDLSTDTYIVSVEIRL